MRRLLKFILKNLAKRVVLRYKPTVVGITGSVGKTTAKEAIHAALSRRFWVRKNEENYNNEFGVPMAVLGIKPTDHKKSEAGFLRKINFLSKIAESVWLAFGWPKQKYPKFLVFELAADKPGDIDYLTDIVKPQIGVVTAVGEVPVHVQFYASPKEVAEEKSKLIQKLPVSDGLAVLNYDDQTVLDMKSKSKAKFVTFGFSNLANVWASDVSYFISDDNQNIGGLSFKINQGSTFVPTRINNMVGTHQLYGILAAAAVAAHFGMNLVDISSSFENIELPHGRMNLVRGTKNSIVIDDTYNASPLSMHAALDTLRDFAKADKELKHVGRRIAVLGDMRELGKYEMEAHAGMGDFAPQCCDILVTVGSAGRLMADAASKQMLPENISSFDTSDDAKAKVQDMVREGDVVLVKGSRSMKMERIVNEIAG